jgi:hypothetical protein
MSLDVYLSSDPKEVKCTCECGHTHTKQSTETVYEANITHNLGVMAKEANIYHHVWRPEEIGIFKAKQLIEPLREGIALMKSDPPRFEKFNASNGWGLYKHFVPFLEQYLEACELHPESDVRVSR